MSIAFSATAAATAVLLGLLVSYAALHHGLVYMAAAVAAVAVITVFTVIPATMLPPIALLMSLLIPAEASFLPKLLEGAALGIVPMAIWMIRAGPSARSPYLLRILATVFGAWIILAEFFAPIRTNRGIEWLIVVEITAVFAVLWPPARFDWRPVRSLFLAITTIVGIYALIEGFVLHSNPLFGTLFEHTTWWHNQRFSASYRVTTLFGHPLDNGLIFSSAAVLAASDIIEKRDHMGFRLARLGVLIGAVAATHARGSAIGFAIGLMAVIIFTRAPVRHYLHSYSSRRVMLTMGAIVAVVALAAALQARNASSQGRGSAAVRTSVVARSTEALRGHELFGVGPGEVDSYRQRTGLSEANLPLENSYAEMAVSLGPIGALLGVMLLLSIVGVGLRSAAIVGEAAALLTILIDLAGYNGLQAIRPVLVIISLLTVAILSGRSASLVQSGTKDSWS